jgi:teichuronic acid exporter
LERKWLPSVVYLQLLSFVGMLFPLHAINLNMLKIQGRSDLFLKLEIFKKILAVPVIIIGISLGIKAMIVAMLGLSVIAFFLNSYYSGRQIGYSSLQQTKDIFPSFMLALFIAAVVYLFWFVFKLAVLFDFNRSIIYRKYFIYYIK